MKEEEFFNKLIDATSNILTKVVEELNRFHTDNNEIVEIKKKEKRNEVIKKCELKEPKNSIEDDEIKMCFVIINSIQKVLFKLCNDSLNKVEKWELKQRLIHLRGNIRYDSNEYRYKKDNKSNISKKFKFNNKECDRNDKE